MMRPDNFRVPAASTILLQKRNFAIRTEISSLRTDLPPETMDGAHGFPHVGPEEKSQNPLGSALLPRLAVRQTDHRRHADSP